MSMHAIEDLVEASIRLLHSAAPVGDRQVRDRIAALYDYQSTYDCSFTHFRVMDVLLGRGFTHRFDLHQHPEYPSRTKFFDELTDFTALAEIDDDEPSAAWLDQGCIDPPHLYCDAGTTLWHTMIEAGLITGIDTEPLRPVPLADVVHEVAVAAEQTGDTETIAMWHALGWTGLCENTWVDHPEELPAINAIREIAIRTGATTFDLPNGYRPPPEFYKDDPIECWWFGTDLADP